MISMTLSGGEQVMSKLRKSGINTLRQIVAESKRTAAEMENYSKDNRPWTDRTGDARRSIYANLVVSVEEIKIVHGIGVDYGVFLELSNGGKYRVISPTVNRYRSIWIKNLGNSLRA